MTHKIYLGSGCFWGTQYHLNRLSNIQTQVGFTGGFLENPTYQEVCSQETGHVEVVEVIYENPKSLHDLLKVYFETHDFTQKNGQGPDIGEQYLSRIFVTEDSQKEIALEYIKWLKNQGKEVATEVLSFQKFYPAETYHQNYYERRHQKPYCHIKTKIFPENFKISCLEK